MKDIFIKNEADTIGASLGIPQKRQNKLFHRMALVLHELFRPTEDGVINWRETQIMTLFLALAETEEERLLCAYMAGRYCEELSAYDCDIEDEF